MQDDPEAAGEYFYEESGRVEGVDYVIAYGAANGEGEPDQQA